MLLPCCLFYREIRIQEEEQIRNLEYIVSICNIELHCLHTYCHNVIENDHLISMSDNKDIFVIFDGLFGSEILTMEEIDFMIVCHHFFCDNI